MKNKALISLLAAFLLTGCSLPGFTKPVEEPKDPSDPTDPVDPVDPVDPGDPGDPLVDGKYPLNAYGDYVKYEDPNKDSASLISDYRALTASQKYLTSGIIEENYQVGLHEFFDINNKVVLTINISNEELQKLDNDYSQNNRESYRICSVDIAYLGMVFHYEEVGIRQKGNTSRGNVLNGEYINLRHYKLSFEETFDDAFTSTPKVWEDDDAKAYREDRTFFGEDKIDIRWNRNEDHSYLKEYYAYEMYRNSGTLAPHSNPINVRMNIDGDEQNCGVYLAVETVSKGFLKRNLKKSARGGDLYKISWGSGVGGQFNSTSDNLFGVETQYSSGSGFYQQNFTYDLKTNKTTSHHETIKSFITDLSPVRGADAYEFMSNHAVYDAFIAFLSCSYLAGDPDDLRGNNNNCYVYFTGDDDRVMFIPTDHDRAFGSCGDGGNPTGSFSINTSLYANKTGYGSSENNYIFSKCLYSSNSTQIRSDYVSKIESIIGGGHFSIDDVNQKFELLVSHYGNSLTLGNRVAYGMIPFGLEESSDIGGYYNLSFATYITAKINAFNSYK